jgi:ribosomal protein L11 methyltransferase
MCASMFEIDLKGARVLDMGTGTGVLAILAEKRGAFAVLAIDNDAWSVENANENCAANQCNVILVKEGDEKRIKVEDKFDVILANINRNVLKLHLPVYAAHLTKDGALLMSGFFVTDREDLEGAAASHGLTLVAVKTEEEWCQLRFRKDH